MLDQTAAPGIGATLAPSKLELARAGETAEAVLTVQNLGTKVDQYLIEVSGLDASWYTLSMASVSLFPRDQDKVLVKLHPTGEGASKGGEFPFAIKLTSRIEPENSLTVPGQLAIHPQVPSKVARSERPDDARRGDTLQPAAASSPDITSASSSAPPSTGASTGAPGTSASSPTTVAPSPPPTLSAPAPVSFRASVAPSSLEVPAVGQAVETTLTVQNKGSVVDQVLIEVEGLNPQWYTLSVSSVSLFPGDQDQVTIRLQPPKDPTIKAGDYPFTVKLTSKADPQNRTTIAGQLTIRPQVSYAFEVTPQRATARRQAKFRITLTNAGNADVRFSLSASDREESCVFKFDTPEPSVPARSKRQVALSVRPHRGWILGPLKNYDLTISAAPLGSGVEPRKAAAQLQHRPLLSSLRPVWRVLKWLITVGVLVGALWFAISYVGGSDEAINLWSKLLNSLGEQLQTVLRRF